MKILVVTQAIDNQDPSLSFFTQWVAELAGRYEKINVVCLKKGKYELPQNVQVYSLGKEEGVSRATYVSRFFRYIFALRGEYDAIFVHQNQEYVLLTGWLWKLWGKKVYLWRNHYRGSFLTDAAMLFCEKIFYTSEFSYTAKSAKAVRMPVGVSVERFEAAADTARDPRSILFLGRIAPSKRPHVLLEALEKLQDQGVVFQCDVVGDALPRDGVYASELHKKAARLGSSVSLLPGVPNAETPRVYAAHSIFVNLSASGMYDKTLFEAAAAECLVVASSKDFAREADPRLVFVEGDTDDLARTLRLLLELPEGERSGMKARLRSLAERNSLSELGQRLEHEMA